ncbi:hypothetical protein [Candidatus Williamhamiltonella defendens]|uniref:Uncharacterized protein n=1 Tax=Candidatus Hamiltonella defensa (Bemisia tabaci) TaxID=672795 RepID=A0A249DY54_9ENTR|nr:hypothetical protein [Candidatus Hamiltonella defensa]ASX26474.1 hypothetical protein BA171_05230 [Candidatus Hamiltonella defensa (Bemisia tabaci)]CED79032.1 Conserved exported hypothetical protein [Candidatus Hamiltonella defensa (Bemisia tabaci)]
MKKFLQFITPGFFLCLSFSIHASSLAGPEKITRDDPLLCEKCCKVTKYPNTFQLCVDNTENVKDWCVDFLNYELPKN